MAQDPHDALLLTRRPTTVVTQATRLHDRMPSPYGAQEDEERLFAGVLADDGAADIAAKLEASKADLVSRLPAVSAGNTGATSAATIAIPSKLSLGVIAAIGLGAYFLFFRR